MFTIVACSIIFIIFIIKATLRYQHENEPPGPSQLPFIGVGHKIDPRGLHYSVDEWGKEHGDVIKFKVFGQDFIALNSFETIYEALVKRSNEFAGRSPSYRLQVLLGHCPCKDIVFGTYSPKWLSMKKLTMQTLKMYGTKLLVLEEITSELNKGMIAELNLAAESGDAIHIKPVLHRCITAIITSIIYGRKMENEAVTAWLKYEEDSNAQLSFSTRGMLLDILPWTQHLPFSNMYSELVRCHQVHRKIIGYEIAKSREIYNPDNVETFIDHIFKHQSENETKLPKDQLSDEDIYMIMFDLTIAGTVTTSLTMTALIACLVNLQEVQQKLADEIQSALGDRPVALEDKSSLPYVEATILEILRYHSMVPLNVIHTAMSDTHIGGYNIPKDTAVFFNLWKLHHDPEFWKEPWEFKPERFLEDGNVVPVDHPNRKRLIPFGAGRRVCAGEVLAKNRMFLMLASLLQHFEFLPESEDKTPNHDPRTFFLGFELLPPPYKVKLVKRNHESRSKATEY